MQFVLRLLFRDERASFLNVKSQCFALHKNFSIQEKVFRIEEFYKNIVDFKGIIFCLL